MSSCSEEPSARIVSARVVQAVAEWTAEASWRQVMLELAAEGEPVVLGDQLFVLGLDGRVLSWSLRPPEP